MLIKQHNTFSESFKCSSSITDHLQLGFLILVMYLSGSAALITVV